MPVNNGHLDGPHWRYSEGVLARAHDEPGIRSAAYSHNWNGISLPTTTTNPPPSNPSHCSPARQRRQLSNRGDNVKAGSLSHKGVYPSPQPSCERRYRIIPINYHGDRGSDDRSLPSLHARLNLGGGRGSDREGSSSFNNEGLLPSVAAGPQRPTSVVGGCTKLVGIVEPIRSDPWQNGLAPHNYPYEEGPIKDWRRSNDDPSPTSPVNGDGPKWGLDGRGTVRDEDDRDRFSTVRTITFRENCPPPPPRRRMSLSGLGPVDSVTRRATGYYNNGAIAPPPARRTDPPTNLFQNLTSSSATFPENLRDALGADHHGSTFDQPVAWFDSSGGPKVGVSGDYVIIPIEYIKSSPYANLAGALGRDIRKTFNKFMGKKSAEPQTVPFISSTPPSPRNTCHRADNIKCPSGGVLRAHPCMPRRNSFSSNDRNYVPKRSNQNGLDDLSISPPRTRDRRFFDGKIPSQPLPLGHSPQSSRRTVGGHKSVITNGGDESTTAPSQPEDFATLVSKIRSLCTPDKSFENGIRGNGAPDPTHPEPTIGRGRPSFENPNVHPNHEPNLPRASQTRSLIQEPQTELGLIAACADLSVSDRVKRIEGRSSDLASAGDSALRSSCRTIPSVRRSASFLVSAPTLPPESSTKVGASKAPGKKGILKNAASFSSDYTSSSTSSRSPLKSFAHESPGDLPRELSHLLADGTKNLAAETGPYGGGTCASLEYGADRSRPLSFPLKERALSSGYLNGYAHPPQPPSTTADSLTPNKQCPTVPKSVRFSDTVRRQFFRVNSCEEDALPADLSPFSTVAYGETGGCGGEISDHAAYVIPRPRIASASALNNGPQKRWGSADTVNLEP